MCTLGKLLKNLRNKKGYSLVKLQEISGVTQGYISDIENERKGVVPKKDKLEDILNALNPTEEEKEEIVKLYSELILTDEMLKIVARTNTDFLERLNDPVKMMTIPVFSSVAAGLGFIPDSEPVEYITIPELAGDCIGARVSGDSMETTFYDGDIVVLKKEIEVNVGEIGVFQNRNTGEALVKRLKKKNGVYVLESDNHIFKDIEIKTDEIVCCGKVVNVVKKDLKKRCNPLLELLDDIPADKIELAEKLLKTLIPQDELKK
ncbi:MAG: LexA family transcriptional regulator [Cetobacterium sp.]|uniref:LexA family transcriptional regulator n=1 Tax=Cetobacterium sp. TaxID=2071632 RepID=UPI003F321FA4